jgi:polyribonucleotide nucleotidyltransferase
VKLEETIQIAGREITLETGEIAKQASGAVIVKQLDTVVLVTVVAAEEARERGGDGDDDFVPLTVEYREKTAAAGRIPSGFIKRETRPQDHEILASRLIDRSIRPLFPNNFCYETQVMATVLSFDPDADPEPLCILGAAAALHLSNIPWQGPVGGVRLVQKNGSLIVFPTLQERENVTIDIVASCAKTGLVMMEGMAQEVSESEFLQALQLVQESLAPFFALMDKWYATLNVQKRVCTPVTFLPELQQKASELFCQPLQQVLQEPYNKQERKKKIKELKQAVVAKLAEAFPEHGGQFSAILGRLSYQTFRQYMVTYQKRVDGRAFSEIRPICGKVHWLPRVHGSALFTRGETQASVTCMLGTSEDEQIVDSLYGEKRERFFLHYNFPSYSVGEVKPMRGPGRREIGHGNLAMRALHVMLPDEKSFAYTIRVVSDITESNGSSSMASVCGGCLSLMDAGVPIRRPVAGVAMGLIQEGEAIMILSDIMGDEDHLGDMDFKVAGSEVGITAAQMDNKIGSLSAEVLARALEQARQGRLHILGEMHKILPKTRPNLSRFAPRIIALYIRKERIRDLIGPGGKNIQEIQEQNKVRIDVNSETGLVRIYSPDEEACKRAVKQVDNLTKELEVGKFYRGVVSGVKDFGAFVRVFANTEGLVHVSELEPTRVERVSDILKEGDKIIVKVLGVDRQGKIRLSRKEALHVSEDKIEN